jgi:hypothetical protein
MLVAVSLLIAAASPAAFAQVAAATPLSLQVASSEDPVSSSLIADVTLPEAPSAQLDADDNPGQLSSTQPVSTAAYVAPYYIKYIHPGWQVQSLSARDKVILSLHDRVDPLNIASMVIAAGYEQVANGAPNYGTNDGAFAARVGAAAIRETTQEFFSDAIFASLLHEDPRYYIRGPQYGVVHRALYAITRPFITRTDNGTATLNGSLLLGYAGSAALTSTYYPQINRNFDDTAKTFGGSIGGEALGFLVYEFSQDVLQKLHLAKKE